MESRVLPLLFHLLLLSLALTKVEGAVEGTLCTTDAQCNQPFQTFMTCTDTTDPANHKCKCPDGSKWDKYDSKCYRQKDTECEQDNVPCTPNSECFEKRCVCHPGFTHGSSDRCMRKLGEKCAGETQCDRDKRQNCLNDRCAHPDGTYIIADGTPDGTLYLLADQPCKSGLEEIPCTPNSQDCAVSGYCKCNNAGGFDVTETKKCAKLYGSECTTSNECDTLDQGEICVPGTSPAPDTCGCPSGSDRLNGKCILRQGQRCIPGGLDCTPNANCDALGSGSCTCLPGYSPTLNGDRCARQYEEPCTTTANCDSDRYLTCLTQGGQCGCPVGQIYDGTKCVLIVGQTCGRVATAQPCVASAYCASDLKCACEPFFDLVNGQCYIPSGEPCGSSSLGVCRVDKNEGCLPSGKCGCNEDTQWFNPETQSCDLKVGDFCSITAGSPACARGSSCQFVNTITNDRKCTCDDGFLNTKDNLCYLKPGQSCNVTNNLCNPYDFQFCDPATRKCGCTNPTESVIEVTWTSGVITEFACKRNFNASCSTFGPSPQACHANSVCDEIDHRCRCDVDNQFSPNSNGRCVKKFGDSCSTTNNCDVDSFHSCTGSSCGCTSDMIQNKYDEKCYVRSNYPCTTSPEGAPCTPGSTCTDIGDNTFRCQCDESEGFADNEEGQCGKTFGVSCEIDNIQEPTCNGAHNLECLGIDCQCRPSYISIVDNATDVTRCVGTHEAPCSIDKDECYREAGLTCQVNIYGVERCDCYVPNEQEYDYYTKRCYSKSNGRCNATEINGNEIPIFCESSLTCNALALTDVPVNSSDIWAPYDGRCSNGAEKLTFLGGGLILIAGLTRFI